VTKPYDVENPGPCMVQAPKSGVIKPVNMIITPFFITGSGNVII